METFCYYLLKSGLVLGLFFLCYQFLLSRETFYTFNRSFLLLGLFTSVLFPLIYITNTTTLPVQHISEATNNIILPNEQNNFIGNSPFNIALAIYGIGASLFLMKFLLQIYKLRKLIQNGNKKHIDSISHTVTTDNVTPFSFFNAIIYNPSLHDKKELKSIISHEEVHAQQKHSYDVVFMEIFLALQWFNPFAWYYRIAIKQNLEFLADTDNTEIKLNKKDYQYILLKQAVGQQNLSIINPFFNSLIKNRIVMINQQKSKKVNAIKSLFILPMLAFFLISFNTKKVYTTNEKNISDNTIEILIDKNTTDAQLVKIKNDLIKESFDFSYTTVRNKNSEIQNISIEINGGNKNKGEVSSRFNSASDNDTIDKIHIIIDTDKNSIFISHVDVAHNVTSAKKTSNSNNNQQISISTSSSGEYDLKVSEETDNGFKFISGNDNKEPLFFVDGKKWESNEVSNLDPNKIASMNVIKGLSAQEKYGEDGKNGVVEITLKK